LIFLMILTMGLLLLLILLIIAAVNLFASRSNVVEEIECAFHVKEPLSKSCFLDIDKKKDGKCELKSERISFGQITHLMNGKCFKVLTCEIDCRFFFKMKVLLKIWSMTYLHLCCKLQKKMVA
jgi:hypothetical protein